MSKLARVGGAVSKRRHHFVPKLYLRHFRSAPRRINVYNLARDKAISGASLRDQGRQARLYGQTDEVEDALGQFEGHVSPILHKIVRDSWLPPARTEEHSSLMFFVALQLTRTPLVANRLDEVADKTFKQVAKEYPGVTSEDLEAVRFGPDNPALASLSYAAAIMYAVIDLKLHLLCAGSDQTFVASDNPAFKYNQYYEGLEGLGVTGPLFRGIQIFLPLSPKHLLLLYDGTVYKVGDKRSDVTSSILNRDLHTLNMMQVVSADQNLYFSDWDMKHEVRRLACDGLKYRADDPTVVQELVPINNDETSSIILAYEPMPNLKLNLSFVGLRRRARKIMGSEHWYGDYRFRKAFPSGESDMSGRVPPEIKTQIYRRK